MNTLSRVVVAITFGIIPLAGTARSQPSRSYNTTFYDSLNPRPPLDGSERYSGMTGYAAPDGREYALLGGFHGTHIIDVTERPIREVAFIEGPPYMAAGAG